MLLEDGSPLAAREEAGADVLRRGTERGTLDSDGRRVGSALSRGPAEAGDGLGALSPPLNWLLICCGGRQAGWKRQHLLSAVLCPEVLLLAQPGRRWVPKC